MHSLLSKGAFVVAFEIGRGFSPGTVEAEKQGFSPRDKPAPLRTGTQGKESISQGLKPSLWAALMARTKVRAYLARTKTAE